MARYATVNTSIRVNQKTSINLKITGIDLTTYKGILRIVIDEVTEWVIDSSTGAPCTLEYVDAGLMDPTDYWVYSGVIRPDDPVDASVIDFGLIPQGSYPYVLDFVDSSGHNEFSLQGTMTFVNAQGSVPDPTSLVGVVIDYTTPNWTGEIEITGDFGQGIPGPQGPPGVDGKSVLYGAGSPDNSLGVDGEFYIDTSVNDLYGPKAAGSWPLGISMIGPDGPPGDKGDASVVPGPQGNPGNDGADSVVPGPEGPAGPEGPQGATGLQGPIGITGSSFIWKGDWAGGANYVIQDSVVYDGASYVCVVDHTSELLAPPDTNAYWDLLAAKGENGADPAPETIRHQGEWDISKSYIPYDQVRHAGGVWLCNIANTGVEPDLVVDTLNTGNWTPLNYPGSGGMNLSAPTALTDIGGGWLPLTQFDTETIAPYGMTLDTGGGTFTLEFLGIWQETFILSITHDNSINGRTTYIRLYDVSDSQELGRIPLGIGRNQEDTYVTLPLFSRIAAASTGDTLRWEIGGGDSITSVTLNAMTFNAFQVSV